MLILPTWPIVILSYYLHYSVYNYQHLPLHQETHLLVLRLSTTTTTTTTTTATTSASTSLHARLPRTAGEKEREGKRASERKREQEREREREKRKRGFTLCAKVTPERGTVRHTAETGRDPLSQKTSSKRARQTLFRTRLELVKSFPFSRDNFFISCV